MDHGIAPPANSWTLSTGTRIPVKSTIIQECPKEPSAWWLVLEPVAGEAGCAMQFCLRKKQRPFGRKAAWKQKKPEDPKILWLSLDAQDNFRHPVHVFLLARDAHHRQQWPPQNQAASASE